MPDSLRRLIETSALPPREARLLVAHALGIDPAWVVAHGDEAPEAAVCEGIRDLLQRRRAGEPVAYLVGQREFYGLELEVSPAVLIPRPETELLVDLARERIVGKPSRVLDLGTGSGAIAIAVAKSAPTADVWAADASPAALALARANAARYAPRVRCVASDWFTALRGERFDLVLANPPYVAADDPHLDEGDLRFEPRAALVGGADGLDCIRQIVREAHDHLARGGWLLFEHGHDQGAACRALLAAAGYTDIATWPDLAGIERISGGRCP